MSGKAVPDTNEWSDRTAELRTDKHLRAQVKRIMKAYRLIHGTKDARSYEEVVDEVAQLVALLETSGEQSTANVGGITVTRGPMEGYAIHLWATDVFVMHLSPFRRAMDFWKRGVKP